MLGHKFLILSAASISIFTFYFTADASTVIFSDGFESDFSNWTGNDSKWDTSGGNIHGGARRGEVKGNTEPGDDVLLKNVSTLGYGGIVLEFWYRIKESLEDDDHVYVEWTGDGSNWSILKDFTLVSNSAVWESNSFPLPIEAEDKSNFAIRFRAHLGAVTGDIFYLDDVVVSAESIMNEPTPVSTGSPQATPTQEPTPDSTPATTPTFTSSPQVTLVSPTPVASPKPTAEAGTLTPTPIPTFSPKLSFSPLSTSSTPLNISEPATSLQVTPALSKNPIPVITSSPKLNQESPNVNKDLTVASQSSEPDFNLSASISNFFNNSKFFWLVGVMILAVVFSLAKPKKD